jgi:hypothetical protein
MAKKATGLNKSEEIRQLLKAHPEMKPKDIVATLSAKGIKVTEALVYFVKGKLKGRKARKKRAGKIVAKTAVTMKSGDPLSTILKVKKLAGELGGLEKLKALVEALS